MSVFRTKKSAPYFWFDFVVNGRRFHGSTRCTNKREAEKFEEVERERARHLVKALRHAAQSLQIDCQRSLATGESLTVTEYNCEPLTRACAAPGAICRSTTEPLRT